MVGNTGLMLLHQGIQIRHIENSDLDQTTAGDDLANPIAQGATEPCLEGHRKTHLRTIKHLTRQVVLECLLKNILTLFAFELHR